MEFHLLIVNRNNRAFFERLRSIHALDKRLSRNSRRQYGYGGARGFESFWQAAVASAKTASNQRPQNRRHNRHVLASVFWILGIILVIDIVA